MQLLDRAACASDQRVDTLHAQAATYPRVQQVDCNLRDKAALMLSKSGVAILSSSGFRLRLILQDFVCHCSILCAEIELSKVVYERERLQCFGQPTKQVGLCSVNAAGKHRSQTSLTVHTHL